jgi:hypothetical protein
MLNIRDYIIIALLSVLIVVCYKHYKFYDKFNKLNNDIKKLESELEKYKTLDYYNNICEMPNNSFCDIEPFKQDNSVSILVNNTEESYINNNTFEEFNNTFNNYIKNNETVIPIDLPEIINNCFLNDNIIHTAQFTESDIKPKVIESQNATSEKAEAQKAETPKAESNNTETPKAESNNTETPKAESNNTETPKAESPKAENNNTETPKAKSNNTETPKAESNNTETPKAESNNMETPKAESKNTKVKIYDIKTLENMKLPDIKKIALENNISLIQNGKNKNKPILIREIIKKSIE